MNIVLIGSGNAATVLGRMTVKAKHIVVQVCGRNKKAVALLANELGAKAATAFENIVSSADLYIIAVSDHAVKEVAQKLQLGNKLVVHTAGSVCKNVLENVSVSFGVLYPLQSLRKELGYLPETPLLVDGSSENVTAKLSSFAKTLSKNVIKASDGQRLKIHTAAVIVSNFTNHLFTLTKDFCSKENIDFTVLLPIIQETVNRLHEHAPAKMQTGPAIREDIETIKNHLDLLQDYPSLEKIYRLMSESIMQTHSTGAIKKIPRGKDRRGSL